MFEYFCRINRTESVVKPDTSYIKNAVAICYNADVDAEEVVNQRIYTKEEALTYTNAPEIADFLSGAGRYLDLMILPQDALLSAYEFDFIKNIAMTILITDEVKEANEVVDFPLLDDVNTCVNFTTTEIEAAKTFAKKGCAFVSDLGAAPLFWTVGTFLNQTIFTDMQAKVSNYFGGGIVDSAVADDLFNERVSFYIENETSSNLGFFASAARQFSYEYIYATVKRELQYQTVNYLAINAPKNTDVKRKLLAVQLNDTMQNFIDMGYIVSASKIVINKTLADFVVSGSFNMDQGQPFWRIQIDLTEA